MSMRSEIPHEDEDSAPACSRRHQVHASFRVTIGVSWERKASLSPPIGWRTLMSGCELPGDRSIKPPRHNTGFQFRRRDSGATPACLRCRPNIKARINGVIRRLAEIGASGVRRAGWMGLIKNLTRSHRAAWLAVSSDWWAQRSRIGKQLKSVSTQGGNSNISDRSGIEGSGYY